MTLHFKLESAQRAYLTSIERSIFVVLRERIGADREIFVAGPGDLLRREGGDAAVLKEIPIPRISLDITPKSMVLSAHPASLRGAYRDRHGM